MIANAGDNLWKCIGKILNNHNKSFCSKRTKVVLGVIFLQLLLIQPQKQLNITIDTYEGKGWRRKEVAITNNQVIKTGNAPMLPFP